MSAPAPLVVGLGAPGAGDDAVGLLIAQKLAAEGLPACEAHDASALLAHFERGQRVILVDAWLAPGRAGEVAHLNANALSTTFGLVSSHALSVTATLALARVLYGDERVHLEIVAIAIAAPPAPAAALSPQTRAAMDVALALIRRMLGTATG